MNSGYSKPINLGNPKEFTILELANLISAKVNREFEIEFKPLPKDDPTQRKPIIELAKKELSWSPKIDLDNGLTKTISYFKKVLKS